MICDECETVAHCMKNGCVPKTTKKDEALKLALEALQEVYFASRSAKHDEAITAIREALAEQPAQRKPLTDDEMWKLWNAEGNDAMNQQEAIAYARAIEAAHGIKEKNSD